MRKKITHSNIDSASFRDPSGFVFYKRNKVFRQVNTSYKMAFDTLKTSGLYEDLLQKQLILRHEEVPITNAVSKNAYRVLETEKIPFITYPYEWCFSQLKDAALTTLRLQKIALKYGMILKDSSAYNIQFHLGKPVLLDILSFEKYEQDMPWVAYRQFCQHFLAPLLLMSATDIRLSQLLRIFIDGIPLDLASRLLPRHTFFNISILSHIHIHALNQNRYAKREKKFGNARKELLPLHNLKIIIDSLESLIKGIEWKKKNSEWGDYYSFTNYTDESFRVKKSIIQKHLKSIRPQTVWDLGANTGVFSRLASDQNCMTLSFDIDPVAVEKNYLENKITGKENLLPLLMDLTNPSCSQGWANIERRSLIERGPADLVLALALIHHLAISNNVPFAHIAEFFSRTARHLIIEFIPKEDSKVHKLLSTRKDIFTKYTQRNFEVEFLKFFQILKVDHITGSKRFIYLLKTR